MTIEDTVVRTGMAQNAFVKIAKLGIDRRERGYRMSLTQREYILPAFSRVFDIEPKKSAEKKCDEGDHRRECSTGMETMIYSVTALPKRQDSYVGVFDGEQFEHSIAKELVPI